jgi:hypothetical protein
MSATDDLFGDIVSRFEGLLQRVELLEKLEFITAGSPTRPPIKTVTTTYTATEQDGIILCDTSGGSFTVSLPPAAVTVNNEAVHFWIKNIGNSPATIDPDGSELIEGFSTATLTRGTSLHVVSDGTEWWVI